MVPCWDVTIYRKPTHTDVYLHCIADRISGLLVNFDIRPAHIPAERNTHMLGQWNNDLGLKVPVMYIIPYKCDIVYAEQSGCTIVRSYKDHAWHIPLYQLAVAEYSIQARYCIVLKATTVLVRIMGYM